MKQLVSLMGNLPILGPSSDTYNQASAGSTYPKKVQFDASKETSCLNTQLANQGYFWVERTPSTADPKKEYVFTARLQEGMGEDLSTLVAKKGGICNDVRTDPDSRQCGLAKSLMETCYTDDIITKNGGYLRSDAWAWGDVSLAKEVHKKCKTLIFVNCRPYPLNKTPNKVCKGYIDAARDTQFELMYTQYFNGIAFEYKIMKVTDALAIFDKDADDFIKNKGNEWFFCMCKEKSCRILRK